MADPLIQASNGKLGTLWRTGWAALLGASLVCVSALANARPDWTLERLMQDLSKVEQRQTRFVETRELGLLQQALTSRGSLSFRRPDRLLKRFDPPNGVSYEIEANRLRIRKADGSEEVVRLDNAPRLLAYVTAMRAVLAGDLEALRRYFELRLEGDHEHWRLFLTPREPTLTRQVKRIEVEGSNQGISRFQILEQSGDRILTRLLPSDEQ